MVTDTAVPIWQHGAMANHLRAWREYRGLSQEALGAAVGATKSAISKLESGDRQLTERWLTELARPLKATPAALLSPPGGDAPAAGLSVGADEVAETDVSEAELLVLEILRDLPKATQRNIIRAAIRQLDHADEPARPTASPRRRA